MLIALGDLLAQARLQFANGVTNELRARLCIGESVDATVIG